MPGEGNPGGNAGGAGASEADVEAIVNRIFSSSSWRQEVQRTVKRNVKLIAKNRELTEENATLKKNGTAPEGGRILSKEENADYAAFVELKVKPADLKATLAEHGKLKADAAILEEQKSYGKAAKYLGFENEAAFTRWLTKEGLELTFQDTQVRAEDGTRATVSVPYVRPKGDDKAQKEALEAYMDREVPDFIDTFKSAPQSAEGEEGAGTEAPEDETPEQLVERMGREARARMAGERGGAGTGVRVAGQRAASGSSQKSKDSKKVTEMTEAAKADPIYAL